MTYIIYSDKERDALLQEVKKSLFDDSKQYFSDIKKNIIKVCNTRIILACIHI